MSDRRRESTGVRRQQITEAALQVIGKKGINGATTSEIASAVGISEGNLYRHFKGKEDIIGSVIDKIGNDLASILDATAGIADPVTRLEEIFKKHLSYIEENVGIPRTVFSEEVLMLNANLRAKVKGNITHYFRGISAVMEQGQDAGAFSRETDPNALTTMFIGTVNFTALQWVMNGFSPSLTAQAGKLWETFAIAVTAKS